MADTSLPGTPMHASSEAVTSQPRLSSADVGGAEGVTKLRRADRVVVQQANPVSEECCCCGYEGENDYLVLDEFGSVLLRGHENSNCCSRQSCERLRSFSMAFTDDEADRDAEPVAKAERPFRCNNVVCCPCLNQSLKVEIPIGHEKYEVEQNVSFFAPSFDIKDTSGKIIYRLEGPSSLEARCREYCACCFRRPVCFRCCCCDCCCRGCDRQNQRMLLAESQFSILDGDSDRRVGIVSRQAAAAIAPVTRQPGLIEAEEEAAENDRYGVDFPPGAGVSAKVAIVTACILIDYLYFEKRQH